MSTNVTRTLVVAVLAVGTLTLHSLVLGAPVAQIGAAAPSGALVAAVRLDPPKPTPPSPSPDIRQIVDLVNAERTAVGLPALGYDARLGSAAQGHSDDQARRGEMSHVGGDGSTVGVRVDRTGYPWRSVAENVAYGYRTPSEVMAGWMASPGHRRNILSANTQLGVGLAFGADGRPYWTQVFAAPR